MRAITMAITICLCTAAGAAAQDAKVSKGEKLYVDQKCALCHSVGDKGNKKGPLDDVGSRLSAAEVHEWLVDPTAMAAKTKATRKPPMKSYTLPKEDADALVTYLMSLKKK
jgi:mono/diheme cytochrome c family protein